MFSIGIKIGVCNFCLDALKEKLQTDYKYISERLLLEYNQLQ